jgi:hypothetical protein
MRRTYEVLNPMDKSQLDTIKVGDYFIYNNQLRYRMKVMAVTKDFIVGMTSKKDFYTLLTKPVTGYVRNAATGTRPTVGPDSFYCLGYATEEEAQKNLDLCQAYFDAEEHRKRDESIYTDENGCTNYAYYNPITQDPRSRYTIDLMTIKVLRS